MEVQLDLNKLPKLLVQYKILSRLNVNTLFSIFQCCKSFSSLSEDDYFWSNHVQFCYKPIISFYKPSDKNWKWVAQCQRRIELNGIKFNGCGTVYLDSTIYIGDFKNSIVHGYCRIIKLNQNGEESISIEGKFEDGEPHGQVTKIYESGVFEGEMKKGKIDGFGTMKWKDGYEYKGEWRDGKRNGEGTLLYPSGTKYVGCFVDNLRNGKGTQYYISGDEFHCDNWIEGSKSISGFFKWINGNTYTGEFLGESMIGGVGEFKEGFSGFTIKGEFVKQQDSKNGIPKEYPECLNPSIIKVLEKKECTRVVTGEKKVFYGQVLYSNSDKIRQFVCESCVVTCRNGTYAYKVFVGNSTCRCGCFDEVPCKLFH